MVNITPGPLFPGEKARVPTEQATRRVTEPVLTFWRIISCRGEDSKPLPRRLVSVTGPLNLL